MTPSVLHRICARPVAVSWIIGACVLDVLVLRLPSNGVRLISIASNWQGMAFLLLAVVAATGLGFFLGMFTCWPWIRPICSRFNGERRSKLVTASWFWRGFTEGQRLRCMRLSPDREAGILQGWISARHRERSVQTFLRSIPSSRSKANKTPDCTQQPPRRAVDPEAQTKRATEGTRAQLNKTTGANSVRDKIQEIIF